MPRIGDSHAATYTRVGVQRTYSEVAEAALGRWGRVLVETMLVLSQTGFCVAYVIFIYKNLPLLPGGKYGITLAVLPFQVRPRRASHPCRHPAIVRELTPPWQRA